MAFVILQSFCVPFFGGFHFSTSLGSQSLTDLNCMHWNWILMLDNTRTDADAG
jgi:hypothetical protein